MAKLLDDYETLVRDLAAFPEMGAPVDLGDGSIGLRWLPLQNLIVVHERRGSDVLLADLFFAGEDWTETLRGRPAD
ncbi:hypothetical protein QJ043_03510 [Olsenella sp. YH-ols2217]|uniref:Type II toxin-antitoxin system RelE/ParE family toxin n=1 Tax=Kribbibacterium absianum TaxID=3044210 RepID=A0ABT6ZJC0_9ACTN|nr:MULTISPECIES: hypothetical protein [unclassified Olsenella]MDJ1122714.1 hypothetical protein [Olsenella sp. YH-ols2216]MDJ1129152.1 hypothetical protein [Olsenella sp. YH-ols2217]